MSDAVKFSLVTALAGLSAVLSAETIVMVSHRAPEWRAAKVEMPAPVSEPAASGSKSAEIRKGGDGHFWADGQVNGANVRFLVDTGATAVALAPRDAEHLGISPADLDFKYHVMTAAGEARAAAVKLDKVTVAGVTLDKVDALVIEKGLDTSLLGMTYLGRLASFQATREALVLHP